MSKPGPRILFVESPDAQRLGNARATAGPGGHSATGGANGQAAPDSPAPPAPPVQPGNRHIATLIDRLGPNCEYTRRVGLDQAIRSLREQDFDIVISPADDFLPLERSLGHDKALLVLDTIGEGAAVVSADGQFAWTNHRLRQFSPRVRDQVAATCKQAMAIFAAQARSGDGQGKVRSKKFSFSVEGRYFELVCSPARDPQADEADAVGQVVAVIWDVTSGRRLQSKIDAIDAAGRELARIESELVETMSPPERLRLLQTKIIKFSKDLMRFDHFAIRLLDRHSNRLEVVIAEGLPLEALEIDLYAEPEGNGISGYVANTGRSYICHDTEKDPRYVVGLNHCKSSLTVPLMLFDRVVGVYNIESEQAGAFDEDDRQFAEIFGRYVAMALNILDLLVVQRYTTSGQITQGVVAEMAGPMNDIVAEARDALRQCSDEQWGEDHPMVHRFNRIIEKVGDIRQAVAEVASGPKTVMACHDDEDEAGDPAQPEFHGRRVLVADDEPNIREAIARVLRRHGCEVVLCRDGYEACEALDTYCGREGQRLGLDQPAGLTGELAADRPGFDLVVSDIKMPYRNGYEIFAAAQRQQETLPVILMTGFGYDPHHSIVRASQEGLASVLFKPFKAEQLLDEVRKAFGQAVEV